MLFKYDCNKTKSSWEELSEEYDEMKEKVKQTKEREEIEKEERILTSRTIKGQIEDLQTKNVVLGEQKQEL